VTPWRDFGGDLLDGVRRFTLLASAHAARRYLVSSMSGDGDADAD
jgi:hypothetical protein